MGLCSPSRQTLRQTLVKESFQISLFWFGFCVGFFFCLFALLYSYLICSLKVWQYMTRKKCCWLYGKSCVWLHITVFWWLLKGEFLWFFVVGFFFVSLFCFVFLSSSYFSKEILRIKCDFKQYTMAQMCLDKTFWKYLYKNCCGCAWKFLELCIPDLSWVSCLFVCRSFKDTCPWIQ